MDRLRVERYYVSQGSWVKNFFYRIWCRDAPRVLDGALHQPADRLASCHRISRFYLGVDVMVHFQPDEGIGEV